jgi:hypothetical protein
MAQKLARAITVVETLVILGVLAVVVGLMPVKMSFNVNDAQRTAALSQAKHIWLMAETAEKEIGWPGDIPNANVNSYLLQFIANGYVKETDLKIFSSPGAPPIQKKEEISASTLTFRIGAISKTNDDSTIFLISRNHPGTHNAVTLSETLNGSRAFIVVRKSGEAGIYNENQMTRTNLFGVLPARWLE